ncbi:MAG: hypothetical protein BalsKO_02210 [Balneolaceae bacterium]
MKISINILKARPSDLEEILDILAANNLPTKDIKESDIDFYVIRDKNRIEACAGVEKYGDKGLLRSVAVQEELRRKGLGRVFIEGLLSKIKKTGILEFYLLTETAQTFFSELGFEVLDRARAPKSIRLSTEFSELCSSTAVFMKKKL